MLGLSSPSRGVHLNQISPFAAWEKPGPVPLPGAMGPPPDVAGKVGTGLPHGYLECAVLSTLLWCTQFLVLGWNSRSQLSPFLAR
jgi:hypothetical protein